MTATETAAAVGASNGTADGTTFSFKNTKLARINLAHIRENAVALRPVDKSTEEYMLLVDSVRKHGIINPISVREVADPNTGQIFYGLVDGLHRYNAALDAGLTEIPANIGSMAEAQLLEAQILANVQKIETKHAQYAKAILAIMAANPTITMEEMASRLSQSKAWLEQRLSLLKLTPDLQQLVDTGKIVLANAVALSKLPPEAQEELKNSAMAQTFAEFGPVANQRKKDIDKAKREGRPEVPTFTPNPRLQKVATLKEDLEALEKSTGRVADLIRNNSITDPIVAAKMAILYVLHLDPISVAADKEKWEVHQKEVADKKAAAEKARTEKTVNEASAAVANAL